MQTFKINGAPVDLLDIGQLAIVNDRTKTVDTWLLDTFFPRRAGFERDEVPIADLQLDNPVAPYVAPCVEGRHLAASGGGEVNFVKPAYLKPKESIEPCKVYDNSLLNLLRQNGIINSGGSRISDGEALLLDQVTKFNRLRQSIDNRKLLMAAEVITTGKVIVESDDFARMVVDYKRNPANSFVPADPWSDSAATPVQDIQAMIDLAVNNGGRMPTVALTSSKVWNALLKHQDFNDTFVKPYAGIEAVYVPTFSDSSKAQFKGFLPGGQIQVWVYDATITVGGVQKRFIPEDYFALTSDTNGYVAQCSIKNLKAFGQPLEYFDYQWYNEDPSAIFMVCESAPLIIPSNASGVVGGTGFVE